MTDYYFRGDFYLPGSEKKYPGRISVDKESQRITLEIFSSESIEGTPIKLGPDSHQQYYHEMIIGEGMGNVTLYHCHWSRTEGLGKDLYQINYSADFLFNG